MRDDPHDLRQIAEHPDSSGIRIRLISAADEIEQLREWKSQAMVELGKWDLVFDALGKPGRLGQNKAKAALQAIREQRG